MAKQFELIYVIPATYSEEEIQPIIDRVTHLIKEIGGEVIQDDNWGKKRLAYPIKHVQYGYYILNVIDLKASQLRKLQNKLKMFQEILRYQIVKAIKKEKTLPIQRPELEKEKPELKPEKRKVISEVGVSEQEIIENRKKKEPEKEKKKKISLEELDKKIDEILEV